MAAPLTPEVLKAILEVVAHNEVVRDRLQYVLFAKAQGREGQAPLFCPRCGFPDQGELEKDAGHCPACGNALVEQPAPTTTAEEYRQALHEEQERLREGDRLTADQPPKGENFLKPSRRSGGRLDGRHIEQRKPSKKARLL
jgi:hypothetical protein